MAAYNYGRIIIINFISTLQPSFLHLLFLQVRVPKF